MKLLFNYIRNHLKDKIKKEEIKNLLKKKEFREKIDLLKAQIDKTREYTNTIPNKTIQPITDDEIIILLYSELTRDEQIKFIKMNSSKKARSNYVAELHLKNEKQEAAVNKKELKEEENPDYIRMQNEREKEKEKLKYMVNEMNLSNELRFHIQETNNKELRERFQHILSQIESYQNLSMADYVEAIKKNYLLLKEEMNQILSDKKTEDRINGFVTNLDIERNVLESRWYYLSNKLNIIDNKFRSYIEALIDNKKMKNEK